MTLLEDRRIRPMLTKTAEPFDSNDYYFEPKWDGLRCIAYVKRGQVSFQNRNLRIVTNSYPELKDIAANLNTKAAVLDGEIVVLRNGLPSFELLQNRFGVEDPVRVQILAKRSPTTYIAFDLLHLNGGDVDDRPLSYRKKMLQRAINDGPHVIVSQHIRGTGRVFFRKAVQLGFEGVIAKKVASAYQFGVRSSDWLKIKKVRTIDCVIAGYTVGEGTRKSTFGALVLGAYDEHNRLVHVGNVGTGFTETELDRIVKLLRLQRTRERTIPGKVEAPSPIKWVKASVVVEIAYTTFTSDMKLRFPRFLRLRLDGNPSDCTIR